MLPVSHFKRAGLFLRHCLFLFPLISGVLQANAQVGDPPSDTIPAGIRIEERGDTLVFGPELRPLRQVAGAPASFYTYFWEMGDGRFSFEKNPKHLFADTGTYLVRLYATNNYDDGKAPPTRPRPVKIKSKAPLQGKAWASGFFKEKGGLEMKINRQPKPGENFVAIAGYRNPYPEETGGSLVFFFNEKQFQGEGFQLDEARAYHREDSSSLSQLLARLDEHDPYPYFARSGPFAGGISYVGEAQTLLRQLQAGYHGNRTIRFNQLQPGEERFLFLDMNTLPEMIRDTNAVVTISAMLVPDNAAYPPELFQLEMEVVASHDPNRLQLRNRKINYRLMGKKKELTYKVRFQNTGEGPAKMVRIGISVPRQLNTQSVKIEGMSPSCTWCDSAYTSQSCFDTIRTADSLYFVFRNIHLPGLRQDGVSDKDSTKGFVEYTLRFRKKPKKIPFHSSAAIVFDKNEPVFTNRATGKFIKGISPGLMAGYVLPSSPGAVRLSGALHTGLVLAPYAPTRPYFQLELHGSLLQEEKQVFPLTTDRRDTSIGQDKYLVTGRQNTHTYRRNTLNLVPLHFRKNLGNWFSLGLGAQADVIVSETEIRTQKVWLAGMNQPDIAQTTAEREQASSTRWLTGWNAAPFVDLQFGRVRQGPALGIRGWRPVKGHGTTGAMVYGIFRL